MRVLCPSILLIAFAWSLPAPAAAAALTLKECIGGAVIHSPALEADRYDVDAASEEIAVQHGALLPDLTGQLNGYELNGSPVYPFSVLNVFVPEARSFVAGRGGTPIRRRVSWGSVSSQVASVNYPLFKYGSVLGLNNAPGVAAARVKLSEHELTMLLSEEKVTMDATVAFLSLLWYRRVSEIDRAKTGFSARRLAVVESEVNLGLKLPQEVRLAKAQLDADQQALASAEQSAREASLGLAALIGLPPDEMLEVDRTELPAATLPLLRDFLAKVLSTHPALRVQQGKIEVARQQYQIARSAILPTATLQTSFTAAEDLDHFGGGSLHERPTLFLSFLQVDLPLLDFGQRRSAARESLDVVRSERAHLSQLELELRITLTRAFNQLHNTESTIAGLDRDVLSADNRVRLARARRAQGMIDEASLLDAESSLLAASEAFASERFTQRLKYAELRNLSGGTWNWFK